jgi:hypothetical protein
MMNNWKSLLIRDSTDWLLEESNPHVRYFTLRWLLDESERSKEVVNTKQAIARSAPVLKLVERQRPSGGWGADPRPHHSTRGPLMLFLWLGAPVCDAIKKALDFRIDGCLLENGAYGMTIKGSTVLLPCHGAELLRQMLRYGYADDPRCRRLLDWLISVQRDDGVWPCVSKTKPYPCMWATADVLRAFRDLPAGWITPQVAVSRDLAVELFLNSDLCRYGKSKPDPDWFRFGFPLHYTSDILEVLELVAPFVNPDDDRIQEALGIVLRKQDTRGRWACEKHLRAAKWIEQYLLLEKIGEPSKWVTLHAMWMLKTLYEGER